MLRSLMALLSLNLIAQAAEPAKVSYYRDVRPILVQNCQGCHQPARAQGDYILSDVKSLKEAGKMGKAPIVVGKPDESYLVELVKLADGKAEMPKGREPLTEKQIQTLRSWIVEGATDDTPASAKAPEISAEKPPVYKSLPVISAVAFSPDGALLAVSGYHEVLLWSADGSKLAGRLVGLSERVQSLAFSPNGEWLAVAGGSPGRFGEVQIWNVDKQELQYAVTLTFDTLYGISWSPDGKMLAVGCSDNTVRGLEAETGRQVLQMGTHSDWVLGTTFSQDGLHLVSVSRDMSVKLTEVAEQRFVDNITSITPGKLKGGLISVALRPQKEKKMQKLPADTPNVKPQVYDEVLFAGADGTPRLYKMHREKKREIGDDDNKVKLYDPMPGRISCVRFDEKGHRFAAVSSLEGKGEIWIFDAAKGEKVACKNVTGPAYAVAWSPDGEKIVSGGFDGVVWLYDAKTGEKIKQFPAAPMNQDRK